MKRLITTLLAALAIAVPFAAASPASAYVHIGACENALRTGSTSGPWGSFGGRDVNYDDDVHAAGVRIGASAFAGYTQFSHITNQKVQGEVLFTVNGYQTFRWGVCNQVGSGDDVLQDWIDT